MPTKYLLSTFSYALLKIPPPFHAIITSSSNMLHASSMINHFKCSIEFNHTSSIQ